MTQGEQDLNAPYRNYQCLTRNPSSTGKGDCTKREVRDSSEAGEAAIHIRAPAWQQGFKSLPQNTHTCPGKAGGWPWESRNIKIQIKIQNISTLQGQRTALTLLSIDR